MTEENIFQSDDTLVLNNTNILTLIGQGNTAEIFDYKDDFVLKLFREGFPEQGVIKEWTITKHVQAVYPMMPKAVQPVACKERRGILYEKAKGCDFFSAVVSKPFSVWDMGRKLAAIHAGIHASAIEGVLTVKDKLIQEIGWANDLSDDEKAVIIKRIEALPNKSALCHFDFHPGNVMMSDSGYWVIDWLTACSGDPASDVARTWLLLKYGEMRNVDRKTSLVVSIVKACIRGQYLRESCRLSHITPKEVKQWIVPVAAARLSEWLTDNERSKLLALIKKDTDCADNRCSAS